MEDSHRVKSYHRTRRRLSVAGFLLELAVPAVMLFTGWNVVWRELAERISGQPALALLIYLGLFGLTTQLVGLPLDYVQGFWLEHRYGLSNLNLRGWVKDQLKGLAVGGALAVVGLEFLYWTMRHWPETWWIVSASAFTGFFIILSNLMPVVILPIFFKFKPLENVPLREKLTELCRRAHRRVMGVYEWKLSEKSKKANAALVGWGNTLRIILSDTLIQDFREDEVEAVLAHELGHHVHWHSFQGMAVQVAATFLGFYLANLTLLRLGADWGFKSLSDFANLPLVTLMAAALSLALLPLVNAHSRFMERQADAYALSALPSESMFVSAMEKLADLNLAERSPHPWIEFIFHSHPSIEKRVAFARNFLAGAGQWPVAASRG